MWVHRQEQFLTHASTYRLDLDRLGDHARNETGARQLQPDPFERLAGLKPRLRVIAVGAKDDEALPAARMRSRR